MQGNSDSDRCSDSDRWSWPGVKRPLEAAEYSFTRKPQQDKATATQIAAAIQIAGPGHGMKRPLVKHSFTTKPQQHARLNLNLNLNLVLALLLLATV